VNSDGEVNNTGIIKIKIKKKETQVQESQKVQSFGKSSGVIP
jgi:hypothetical protein